MNHRTVQEVATCTPAPRSVRGALLRAEHVRQLCRQLPASMASTLLLGGTFLLVMWTAGHRRALLAWAAALGALTVWRLRLYVRHRLFTTADVAATLGLSHALTAGAMLSAALWGSVGALFYPTGNLVLEAFAIMVLCGVTAGASTSLATDRNASLYFPVIVLGPLAARLLAERDGTHATMAVMVAIYGAFIYASSQRVRAHIDDNTSLRLDAIDRENQLQESETRYRQLAHHDALTGLLNRHSFQARLPELLAHAARSGTRVALIFLDIDNFKDVNDARGHGCGDQLLVAVANRLRQCTSADDLVVRMGGDEFIVVTTHAGDRAAVEQLAQRIRAGIGASLAFSGETINVRVSIGIGIYPDDGVDAEVLIKYADIALYQAKAAGRNNYQFFAAGMSQTVEERIFLEQSLARAIGTPQLFVQYQPLVDLPSGRVIGFEALTRWRHPDRGLVSPAAFIPIAEQSGLINAAGEQLLRTVCAQLAAWQDEGLPLVPVAVNVSPRQFEHGHLAEQLVAITQEAGIDPSLLQVELTESALMKYIEGHGNTLQALRDIGVRVAIDDFGTGYSSLSYLKHLPIDSLKIDRSFVRDMVDDPRDAAIVSAVIGIAHSLDIRVVAEGVESTQQAQKLRELGCVAGQGYLFHRPMSPERCRVLLASLRQPVASETMRLRVLRWVAGSGER